MGLDTTVIRKRFLDRWSNIPMQFRNWTLEDCDPLVADPKAVEDVRDFAVNFVDYARDGRGLLMVGPPGRGKTALGCAVLNHVMAEHNLAAKFYTMQGYIRDLQEIIQINKSDSPDEERLVELKSNVNKAATYPLLQLDDVGKEYRAASGYAVEQFDHLLRQRHSNQRPTIITSNLALKNWDAVYDASMKSYVVEACKYVRVGGVDLRELLSDD